MERGVAATGYNLLLLARARASLDIGEHLDAEFDLREVIRLDPTCTQAHRLLAEVAAQRYARGSARAIPEPRRVARGTEPPFTTRFGRYTVFEKLGEGGLASVHRAAVELDGINRAVALKRLSPERAEDDDAIHAFQHEARLGRRLRHPGIAAVHDSGSVDGVHYIAMEFVAGGTLCDRLNRGPVALPHALAVLFQLADALTHVHALGVVHRDLSPSNVMFAADGTVKLIDFGIARSRDQSWRTRAGIVKGKLGYIAPEYLRGELDARADLFALGVIAHELLTGRRLFRATSDLATLQQLLAREIAPPSRTNPAVTATIDDIVMLALRRDPAERWQSAAAMRRALLDAADELTYGGGVFALSDHSFL